MCFGWLVLFLAVVVFEGEFVGWLGLFCCVVGLGSVGGLNCWEIAKGWVLLFGNTEQLGVYLGWFVVLNFSF